MPLCPSCGAEFESNTKFCKTCGANLESEYPLEPVCPMCRKQFPEGTKYCDVDGTKLVGKDKMVPRCEKCGESYPDGSQFCPKDGGRISPEALRKKTWATFSSSKDSDAGIVEPKDPSTLISDGYAVDLGKSFQITFELVKSNILHLLAFAALSFALLAVVGIIGAGAVEANPAVGAIVSTFGGFVLLAFVFPIMYAGFFSYTFERLRGAPARSRAVL